MESLKKLAILHQCGLNLGNKNINLEIETNTLINKRLNEMTIELGRAFKEGRDTIIFHSFDDIPSLISYTLLKMCPSSRNFNLYFCGSRKHTRKNFDKEDKFISIRRAKKILKLNKDSAVLILPSTPLYQVIGVEKKYNQLISEELRVITPISDFNFRQLCQTQLFYKINYLKKEKIQSGGSLTVDETRRVLALSYYQTSDSSDFFPYDFCPICEGFKEDWHGVYCVWLTGDNDVDMECLQNLEDKNGLFFYYFDESKVPPAILDSNFQFYFKSNVAVPMKDVNVNVYHDFSKAIKNELSIYGGIYLVGEMPQGVADKICPIKESVSAYAQIVEG